MKILLLQLKRIGDLILTTPAIAALRKNYPDAQITLAVSNECAELLPAIAKVDRFLIARRNLRDVAMVSSVAGKTFDYCVDFTRNDRSAFLTLLSKARKRIASYRVREQSKTRARVYTDLVGVRVRDMHTIDYNLALLKPLSVSAPSSAPQLDLPRRGAASLPQGPRAREPAAQPAVSAGHRAFRGRRDEGGLAHRSKMSQIADSSSGVCTAKPKRNAATSPCARCVEPGASTRFCARARVTRASTAAALAIRTHSASPPLGASHAKLADSVGLAANQLGASAFEALRRGGLLGRTSPGADAMHDGR